MKNEQNVREILVNNTIQLIAEGGFEKATTKAITHAGGNLPDVKMNEVYIYRLFGSKEHLYEVAFSRLDAEVVSALRSAVEKTERSAADVKSKLYELFMLAWRFLLKNESHCRCYVRYYYSVYFKGKSLQDHNELFKEIFGWFAPLFKENADVKSIMHSVYTAMLDFAVRVYNGDLQDTQMNAEHIFNVVYCMMMTYFKDSTAQSKSNISTEGVSYE